MKMNKVFLQGQVMQDPRIAKNGDTPVSAAFGLKVYRRKGSSDNTRRPVEEKLFADTPVIRSKNPEMIEAMSDLREGDIVYIIGVVVTKELMKRSICPFCGCNNEFEGTAFFVNPLSIQVEERGLSPEDGFVLLMSRLESSNNAYLAGQLCRDTNLYDENNRQVCQYQIACNRRVRIKEDAPEIETDYPWIKSYGLMAKENAEALSMGSEIFVDGSIQTREYEKKVACTECGGQYKLVDNSAEIVPYYVGYLKNCELPASEHADAE